MGHTQSKGNLDPAQNAEEQAESSSGPRIAHDPACPPNSSTSGRRKRHRSGSSSADEGRAGSHDPEITLDSKRRRRLSWRPSMGLARKHSSSDASNAPQHDQQQPSEQPSCDAMHVDDETPPASMRPEIRGASKGKQREMPEPNALSTDNSIGSSSSQALSADDAPDAPPSALRVAPNREAGSNAEAESFRASSDPFRHLWESNRPSDTSAVATEANGDGQPSTATEEETDPNRVRTPPPHLDALLDERARARRSIEEALGRLPAPAIDSTPASAPTSDGATESRAAPSSTLSTLLGEMLGMRGASGQRSAGNGSDPQTTASDTSNANEANAQQQHLPQPPPRPQLQPQPGQPQPPGNQPQERTRLTQNMISGTSVIVQGALIARTVPSHRSRPRRFNQSSAQTGTPSADGQNDRPSSSTTADPEAAAASPLSTQEQRPTDSSSAPDSQSRPRLARRASEPIPAGLRMGAGEAGDSMQTATLEEQAAMLSRILGIATAATAASLVNPAGSHAADRALLQSTLQPAVDSFGGRRRRPFGQSREAPSSSDQEHSRQGPSASSGHGLNLRQRLLSIPARTRTLSGVSTASADRTGTDLTESQRAARDSRNWLRQRLPWTSLGHDSARNGENRGNEVAATTQPETSGSLTSSGASSTSTSSSLSASSWARFLRETARHIRLSARAASRIGVRDGAEGAAGTAPAADTAASGSTGRRGDHTDGGLPDGHSIGPNDIAGPLRLVREGLPVPQGEAGSFGNFLHHLLRDLDVAVQSIRPPELEQADVRTTDYFEQADGAEATNGAEVLDGEGATGPGASSTVQEEQEGQQQEPEPQSPTTESADRVDSEEDRARRERDVEGGRLNFFRLFRFDPVAPSTLVPCVVVGVRSLGATETLHGEAGVVPPGSGGAGRVPASRPTELGRDPESRPEVGGASLDANSRPDGTSSTVPSGSDAADIATATDNEAGSTTATADEASRTTGSTGTDSAAAGPEANDQPANDEGDAPTSRFLLFVSGGRYPANHPLLTANPSAAGRDLMLLLELLGMMSAMQSKPSTVTQQEIDASDLRKAKGSEIASLLEQGKVRENMAERCLVCLEDWTAEDDCRLLACQHVFHTTCVDRWMTSSSNTCPMCRRQGVTKDGTSAGEETPESRSAAAGAGPNGTGGGRGENAPIG